MNVVITNGVALMPRKFREGLDYWSSGDGRPGSDTYAGSGPGVFVPADSQFDGCLEISKAQPVVQVRYMDVTPILRGTYIRVTARFKAVSGELPTVRIAGTPLSGSTVISGVATQGPSRVPTSYGTVYEVSAIIGTGARQGVDIVWPTANGGHLGVDISGPNGGIIRVDDIEIEDVTNVFLRGMLGLVDVRDFGAIGDGVTDDSAAFIAADAAANGREVLISAGTYRLNNHVTFQSQVRFEGRIVMPRNKHLIFQRNFDYATYADAFGDEEEAFKRAWQALLNYSDHNGLDLCGRRIAVTAPIDMAAAEGSKSTFETRRLIFNGELHAVAGPAWTSAVATSQASYSSANPRVLTNVSNVANVEVGALVTGTGVGREVYVRERNIGAQTLTLSAPLYDAQGTQVFTFTRFKYLFDFSGFQKISNLVFHDLHLSCEGVCSAIMLAPAGMNVQIRDTQISKPADRGITSIGRGCQDLTIDRCQFFSNEMSAPVPNRKTLVLNSNANDVKLRDNRIVRFRHFAVMGGEGALITGNHWFHGDDVSDGIRLGGLVITTTNPRSMIDGNYIDNNFIEWTNEHEVNPAFANQFSFGGLTITSNTFMNIDVADWFNWIVIKPYGPGHFIHGLSVVGNVFRSTSGRIERIERVDSSIADLDRSRMRNVVFSDNVFHNIDIETRNPLSVDHDQTSAASTWTLGTNGRLPFGGYARTVEAIVPESRLRNGSGAFVYTMPGVTKSEGTNNDQIKLHWPESTRGAVRVSVRMDNPN